MRGSLFTLLFSPRPRCMRTRPRLHARARPFSFACTPSLTVFLARTRERRLLSSIAQVVDTCAAQRLQAKDVYSKEYRHAQHKLPDFSTSIRISQVERLLKALFPAVFLPNRCLYLKKCRTATEIRNFVINLTFCERKDPPKEQGPATRPRRTYTIPSPVPAKRTRNNQNMTVHLMLCTFWKLLPPKRNANGLPRARPRCYDAVAVSGRGEIPHWR